MRKFEVVAKIGKRTLTEIIRDFNRQELYDMAQSFDRNVVHLEKESVRSIAIYVYDQCQIVRNG